VHAQRSRQGVKSAGRRRHCYLCYLYQTMALPTWRTHLSYRLAPAPAITIVLPTPPAALLLRHTTDIIDAGEFALNQLQLRALFARRFCASFTCITFVLLALCASINRAWRRGAGGGAQRRARAWRGRHGRRLRASAAPQTRRDQQVKARGRPAPQALPPRMKAKNEGIIGRKCGGCRRMVYD